MQAMWHSMAGQKLVFNIVHRSWYWSTSNIANSCRTFYFSLVHNLRVFIITGVYLHRKNMFVFDVCLFVADRWYSLPVARA